ncbi:nitrite/sulfite reductase [Anaeromyxobacter paludicola]|uniref:Ferredoxin--nitrite reductase n=1 Tax=Anaeromyxobacter paludicola TaxID=2918171 RepID=A0ABM7X9B7_9BACT|nr:nitrite/sulfite reductase [Anaeromyxobacter paludicola]BDG08444.1 ferredoxin--nitrite reductase [Anaeromyxobacter paludicola]
MSASHPRPGFSHPSDLASFLEMLGRFERGEIGADAWRAFRLLRGNYPQRQGGEENMLRVKLPQGIATAGQLRALAEVAERHSRAFAHVTTRENVQFHFVQSAELPAALTRLAEAGLTTVEACGNAVRNVVGCPFAGVAADEPFDPTPYAEAVSRHFLRHPLSSTLPRKFKIAFEGCSEDHVLTPIHDLGFRARVEGGRRGFAVTAAGGTATLCAAGQPLTPFLPAGEVLDLVEAVLRVFHRLGDRQNRKKNRMKFLVRQLGWERFQAEVAAERERVRAEGGARLPFDAEAAPEERAPEGRAPAPSPAEVAALATAGSLTGPGLHPRVSPTLDPGAAAFEAWRASNVRPQRQPGLAAVTALLPLGDATSGQLRALALLAEAYGDGTVRFTRTQDAVLRWVPEEALVGLYLRLAAAGLGLAGAGTAADVVACPGAETCRLAVTQSRGVARLVEDHLRARPALAAAAPGLEVNVSGCPNGCSQHHVAGIGLQGSARKLEGGAVPQYFLLVGGGVVGGEARFGRLAAKIPARRVPAAVERLIGLYQAEREAGESAPAFLARVEVARVKALLRDLEAIDAASARPEDYVDPGDDRPFRPGEETT